MFVSMAAQPKTEQAVAIILRSSQPRAFSTNGPLAIWPQLWRAQSWTRYRPVRGSRRNCCPK